MGIVLPRTQHGHPSIRSPRAQSQLPQLSLHWIWSSRSTNEKKLGHSRLRELSRASIQPHPSAPTRLWGPPHLRSSLCGMPHPRQLSRLCLAGLLERDPALRELRKIRRQALEKLSPLPHQAHCFFSITNDKGHLRVRAHCTAFGLSNLLIEHG